MTLNKLMENLRFHAFYLLKDSLLPLLVSCNLLSIVSGTIEMFESSISLGNDFTLLGVINLILIMSLWMIEYKNEWHAFVYTKEEAKNVRLGFFLFIISEVMFFFSFFFLYFYNSIWVMPEHFGFIWPSANIPILSSISVALPLTMLLLTSSGTINVAVIALLAGQSTTVLIYTLLTLLLGSLFIALQLMEYNELVFGINESIAGSIFFMITGLHGLHVFLGICLIFCCFIYLTTNAYLTINKLSEAYVFIEVSAWYWHFVDFVWLIVYTWLYDWRIVFNLSWLDLYKIFDRVMTVIGAI
jgi:heme/copper-type cytochrome/quinol oxidase subunit 3